MKLCSLHTLPKGATIQDIKYNKIKLKLFIKIWNLKPIYLRNLEDIRKKIKKKLKFSEKILERVKIKNLKISSYTVGFSPCYSHFFQFQSSLLAPLSIIRVY